MKLFKILSISIISILIFQSQLYGINLSCDFKRKVNKTDFNGIHCNSETEGICGEGNSGEYDEWISEVIIKNKDVEIFTRKRKKELRDRILKVDSEVHQQTLDFDGNKMYAPIVLQSAKNESISSDGT